MTKAPTTPKPCPAATALDCMMTSEYVCDVSICHTRHTGWAAAHKAAKR